MGWSRNVLLNQIKADAYRISLKKKQHNFEKALPLGSGFSFISNQYRLELEGDEYFVDLLFFNRKLKCLMTYVKHLSKFISKN
jgi:predicted nuclease of restriction endonuclease-like (RecB) superfamily